MAFQGILGATLAFMSLLLGGSATIRVALKVLDIGTATITTDNSLNPYVIASITIILICLIG